MLLGMWYLPATVQFCSEPLEVSDPSTILTDQRRGTIPVVTAVGLPYLPSSLVTACVETLHHFDSTEWDGEGWCASQYFLLCGTWYLFTTSLVSQPLETLHHFDRTELGGLEGRGVASSYCCMAHGIYLLHLWSQPLENLHHFDRAEV